MQGGLHAFINPIIMRIFPTLAVLGSGFLYSALNPSVALAAPSPELPTLIVKGEDFVDAAGSPVRFWGVNLVGVYPEKERADAMATYLAALQVNLVRPHHLLRPSLDWNPKMKSGSLLSYRNNSREFDPVALDRFDYLNAALRRHGIYLAFSAHFSRRYLTGDVDILKTDAKDRSTWMAAMREIMGWNWQKSIDPLKMLPVIDERAALLTEEFVKKLLTHVNPYTGIAYGVDPQILTMEIANEASTEYGIICGNRFPDYWQAQLVEKWETFARAESIEPGDIYKPANDQVKDARARFLRKLDEDYAKRIAAVIRGTGYKSAITYSNLWRGDAAAEMHARIADQIEDHNYMDPMVAGGLTDGIYELSRSALVNKPFFIGELNQGEGSANIARQSPERTMLPLAISAYGSLHNWSGVVWFAWMHGDTMQAEDGWANNEGRVSSLGNMINDGMVIDHLRTTGMIFRKGLVAKSTAPVTLTVDPPFTAGDYKGLMRGKYVYRPGWQAVHAVRKAFGPAPAEQANAPWMTQSPPNPVSSDTGEIVRDIERKQLSVAAPKAEAFSGYLDGKSPAGLKQLELKGSGFATVVVVASDDKALTDSERLIVSRTGLNAAKSETAEPRVILRGLKPPGKGQEWSIRLTRPRAAAALMKDFTEQDDQRLQPAADGTLELPLAQWHECELILKKLK